MAEHVMLIWWVIPYNDELTGVAGQNEGPLTLQLVIS